ncbi:Uncharacterised protein [Mycobacteroides abscessus subsp. abscessus]|nr:Uncharacterised protein [Mycobacteroides abscessus subsp. abscessus]SKW33574.1 Uncharacterised protein [Mycobacteroides abscessus subsp. abscessus]
MSSTRVWYWPSTTPLFGGPPCPSSDKVCETPGKFSAMPALCAAAATSSGPFFSFSMRR